ncbi:MAG: extracellular solute-binding protein [Ruminococcaceae bacterium]|nr:extracellular solute-binding protein [Oscillospiraceae bacterium]
MYVRGNQAHAEFYVEEATGDIVDDAIYNRNLAVSERLNVKLEFREEDGDYANRAKFVSIISQSILAGDEAFDIAAGYSMSIASMAADGLLRDLTSTDYLDFDQPWWSNKLLTQTTVGGKLYFASGDISTNMLYYMYATFFNKALLENFKLENPYELAKNKKWTIDKMASMAKNVYADLNGNNRKDADDQFGYAAHELFNDAYYFTSGLTYTKLDSDGMPVLTDDLMSERAADLVAKLNTLFHTTNDFFIDTVENTFETGNILFQTSELEMAKLLRDVSFEFGIVPVPTYDEGVDFVTVASFPVTFYSIPIDAKDPDMSSAVLEALAAESHYTVVPALFETAMKVKYTSDDDAAQMFDIIRESMCFDFGRIFNDSLNAKTFSIFRSAIANNTSSWSSTVTSQFEVLTTSFDKLIAKFEVTD